MVLPPSWRTSRSSTRRVGCTTGGASAVRLGLPAVASSALAEVGWAMNSASAGKAELPAVWSPWSEQITTCVIGRSVTEAMCSMSRWVSATLPWPSATSTPSSVTTNMLTVVKRWSPAERSAS